MCQNRIAIKILNHFWNAKSMVTLNTVLHEQHEVHSGHSNWTRRYIYTYIHIYAWRAILRRKILYHRPAPVSATWATTLPPFPHSTTPFFGEFHRKSQPEWHWQWRQRRQRASFVAAYGCHSMGSISTLCSTHQPPFRPSSTIPWESG